MFLLCTPPMHAGDAQPPARDIHVGGVCSVCAADTQWGATNREMDDHFIGNTACVGRGDGVLAEGWYNGQRVECAVLSV